jgi:hypothetical protein
MPVMDCPNCSGTGYTQDAGGELMVCPVCKGPASCSTTRVTLARTLPDA